MKKNILLLLVIYQALSCHHQADKQVVGNRDFAKIQQLHWLIGNWQNITPEKQSYERWKQQNDSTLVAHSFTIVDNDTVFAERITVKETATDLLLTAIAYQQNDDKPVSFKLIPSEAGIFTFENPNHDFPSRISYSNPVADSIHAWIEGKSEGTTRKVNFYFERQN